MTNRDLLLPFLIPYLLYVAASSLRIPPEWAYALRLTAVPALLVWAWRWYSSLTGPRSPLGSVWVGSVAGLGGAVLWVALLAPFAGEPGEPWSGRAFGLRLAASSLVVPVFEELLMRGYFLRVALQWDRSRREGGRDARTALTEALDERSLLDVEPGAWSAWAVAISTIAFTAGHLVAEWPASVAYGLLMSWLWIVRRDLLSCVVAHGVTNAALAVFVRATGLWQFW